MTEKNNSKIFERVRALLAMAKDVSSPHEAGIALNRARKLMDEHQISEIDLHGMGTDSIRVHEYAGYSPKRAEHWFEHVVIGIAKLNDCLLDSYRRADKTIVIEFKGFEADTQVCEYMADYVREQACRLWEQDKAKHGFTGAKSRNDWYLGFAMAVRDLIDDMMRVRDEHLKSSSAGERGQSRALMLNKRALVAQTLNQDEDAGVISNKRRGNRVQEAYHAGRASAGKVHLGKFIDNQHGMVKLA